MAIFGNISTGGGSYSYIPISQGNVSNFILLEDGDVTKLTVEAAGGVDVKGIIYADSSGVPGERKGVSSITAIGSRGQYDLVFPVPIALTAGTYWLGLVSGGTAISFYINSSAGNKVYGNGSLGYDFPADPFGGSQLNDNYASHVFATYDPVGRTRFPLPSFKG
jgi:hypothetical protein